MAQNNTPQISFPPTYEGFHCWSLLIPNYNDRMGMMQNHCDLGYADMLADTLTLVEKE
jgi:hypothetical protein